MKWLVILLVLGTLDVSMQVENTDEVLSDSQDEFEVDAQEVEVSPFNSMAPPPGAKFDLSVWNLQLPIGSPGKPTTILSAKLVGANGYQDKHFYTDAGDASMVMFAPDKGVTTTNSNYPRTELREVVKTTGANANWDPRKTDSFSVAKVRVATVTTTVVIGQIVVGSAIDKNLAASTKPLMELYYSKNGDINVGVQKDPQGTQSKTKITNIKLGNFFNYTISLTGKKSGALPLKVNINGINYNFQMPASFSGYGLYFKAGSYNQEANGASTANGAIVKFYSLKITHS